MKNIIISMVLALVMTGCTTIPKTTSQLVETASTTQTYCYSLPAGEVEKRLESILTRCFAPDDLIIETGGVSVPVGWMNQVMQEKIPNGNRYSLKHFLGYGYCVNVIEGSENCETEVQMFAVSSVWEKNFSLIDSLIQTQELTCRR